MKSRRVTIMLELDSAAKVDAIEAWIRGDAKWYGYGTLVQFQANVIRPTKPTKKRAAKRKAGK